MLIENGARYEIWKKLKDPFDYNEFCEACVKADTTPMTALDFAVKVGQLVVGHRLYSDLDEKEAYVKLGQEHELIQTMPFAHRFKPRGQVLGIETLYKDGKLPEGVLTVAQAIEHGKSCCGGGKVR